MLRDKYHKTDPAHKCSIVLTWVVCSGRVHIIPESRRGGAQNIIWYQTLPSNLAVDIETPRGLAQLIG